jgi:hypothetical protein
MADTKLRDDAEASSPERAKGHEVLDGNVSDNSSTIEAETYAYSEDRKIGVTGAVFLILNKMIGTGSEQPYRIPSHK